MSWSYIDSTKADGTSTATSYTVTLPSYSSGDLAIITAYKDQDLGDWSTSATGWNLLSSNRAATGRDRSTAVFYKVLGSGESNPAIAYSNANNEEYSWTCHVFRSTGTLSNGTVIDDWAFDSNQNIQNPTPQGVTTVDDNALVFVVQMQTHDDCTGVGAPTGFTLGETIFGGSKDNRQQITCYDLDVGAAGSKSFGAMTSTWNNTVSEYSIYSIAFKEAPESAIDSIDDTTWVKDQTNITISGFGFGSTQGTGKVEVGNRANYADCTTLVTQSIDTWGDTSIQFDFTSTGLFLGALFVYVTKDNGYRPESYPVSYGAVYTRTAYNSAVSGLTNDPDIYHRFNNSYADIGSSAGDFPANGQTSAGIFGFVATPITEGNTHSWTVENGSSRIEMADSQWTNVTNQHTQRLIGGWFMLNEVYKEPVALYEEGGGVNNLYIVIGIGNIMLGNIADSSKSFKVQAYSDFKLKANRPYHVVIKFIGGATDGNFTMFVDGIEVAETDGNPIASVNMSTHSGDWAYGRPDGNLDTGGTDIQYSAAANALWSDWATWSAAGNGLPSDAEIRTELFEKAPLPLAVIESDTEVNMQTAIDTFDGVSFPDSPLCILVARKTGGGDLRLEVNNITFDDMASMHIQWLGTAGETLTLVNQNGSNLDSTKVSSPYGGDTAIENPATLTVNGLIDGAEVRIYDDNGSSGSYGDELSGVESNTGTSYLYSHDGSTNDIVVQHIKSGYVESNVPFTLGSSDQSLTIIPRTELND